MTDEKTKTNDTDKRPAVQIRHGGGDAARRVQPCNELDQSERDLNTFMAIACAVAIEDAAGAQKAGGDAR